MWRRVEIENYRSIEHVKVDLAPFTVLVGPNGSGKSSFADALVLVRDMATDAASAVERRGGIDGLRRWSPGHPRDVSVDVRAGRSPKSLDTGYVRHQLTIGGTGQEGWCFRREIIEQQSRAGRASIVREGREVDVTTHAGGAVARGARQAAIAGGRRGGAVARGGRSAARAGTGNGASVLRDTGSAMVLARQLAAFDDAPIDSVRRLRLSPELMRVPQPALERTSLDESGEGIATAFRSLPTEGREQVVLAMSKLIPGLVDVRVESIVGYLAPTFLQQQPGGTALFSATQMSDGALRAFGILVAAEQMTEDELLIIEEPEAGIHPGAAHLLFDVLEEASRRGAVLITTHSPDLLDAARDQEILVCSYRDGTTHVGPLASEQRAVVKEGLFAIAELMRSETLRIEGEPLGAVEV